MKKKYSFGAFIIIGLISFIFFSFISKKTNPKPPNVIIIYMDDLGYGDLGCYGATGYQTPNIDRLASEGMRFTNFLVAQPVCTASRAALLTGCYPNRIGMSGVLFPNSKTGLNTTEWTISKMFKEKNYKTALFGKWHLGDNPAFMPLNQGFDIFVGLPYSSDMWPVDYDGKTPLKEDDWRIKAFPSLFLLDGAKPIKEIKTLDDQAFLTREYTSRTIDFIKKNKNTPFFAYVAHTLPHVPIAASDNFKNKTERGLFGDMMEELDWSVGQILTALKENGLDKNTIVILASDNGPWKNYGNHAGSTGGMKEGKGVTFEGGSRVPCIIRWPGVVPAGLVCNRLTSNIDILPTLAEACHTKLSKNNIDGVSLMSLLKGDFKQEPRKNFLYYYRKNNLEAVRIGDWKLVFEHPGRNFTNFVPGKDGYPGKTNENYLYPRALYNLGNDPGEIYDLQNDYPEKVKELEVLATSARDDLGDDLSQKEATNKREMGKVD